MAKIPGMVAESDLSRKLAAAGLTRAHQGKVRDTYFLPNHPDKRFVVATDRLSIFDFVLPKLVPLKGEVLTALTLFWLRNVLRCYKHHLLAGGRQIDRFLPEALQGDVDLWHRGLVVQYLDMLPIECIVRGYLTGSGLKSYARDGQVCGHKLSAGLYDGSELPMPLFTPTTKAEVGHDVHVTAASVRADHGTGPEDLALSVYRTAAEYARRRGVILADTKFEFGWEPDQSTGLRIADEVLTPDSSRYWLLRDWELAAAQQKSPPSYDKQGVRNWGLGLTTPFGLSFDRLDPESEEHLSFVEGIEVPDAVVGQTVGRYEQIFELLTGRSLRQWQRSEMEN